jgi:VWFA-related protein
MLSLAALLTGLPVAGAQAQTSRRRAQTRAKPGTVKICRGLSIPDGYTIVAETTSPDCPEGAYIIKREGTAVASTRQSLPAVNPPARPASRPRRVARETTINRGGPPTQTAGGPPVLAGSTISAAAASPSPLSAPASDSAPQEVGDGDVVRVDTNLVTVPVSVFDRQGRFIADLRRQDFRIFDNGVEQEIAYFEPTEKPFTVALLLDTSASTRFRLSEIQKAAIAFARQLHPQDRVLVVTFNDEVLLLTEATNDQNVISDVITVNARTGNSTRLYDAVELVIRERLNKVSGRKAIVLFTDGVDTSSHVASYESTIREVEEFDALVYPIRYDTFEDLNAATSGSITVTTRSNSWPFPGRTRSSSATYRWPSVGPPPPGFTRADYDRAGHYLSALADKTGGQIYSADDPRQLAQVFTKIAEELRHQYSLGYYPKERPAGAGERRQIGVRVLRPELAVRARDGYIAKGAGGTR